MSVNLDDVRIFAAVARAGGFREAGRAGAMRASTASEAVRRLESEIGTRLLNRSTRSVAPTEAGARLLERLGPALAEIESALDAVESARDRPAGTLRLNVPTVAARFLLPRIVPPFLAAHPDVRLEVTADDGLIDIVAAGCDAGVRYGHTIEKDMIAVALGPAVQRLALVASPTYLEARGRPRHPSALIEHACLRVRFATGAVIPWSFARDGETVTIDPPAALVVSLGGIDLALQTAIAGGGLLYTYEEWAEPHLESGALEPVLQRWWARLPGPSLYYTSRRHMPAALRAFLDFVARKRTPRPPLEGRGARSSRE
ncbi:MAG: LysR family transcriptional regulator [Deltaproteobacteria bacterium]|nr:LysR family transcriptional regulator [Deltaproteobacteria bacterium]